MYCSKKNQKIEILFLNIDRRGKEGRSLRYDKIWYLKGKGCLKLS